jgi:hypothetical protein
MFPLVPTLLNYYPIKPEPPNLRSEVHDVHGRNETRSKYLRDIFNRRLLPKMGEVQSIRFITWVIVVAAIIGPLA